MSTTTAIEAICAPVIDGCTRLARSDLGERAARQIRVLIADDQAFLRRGLAALVNRQPDMEVCGEVFQPGQTLSVVASLRPDVVVMELRLQHEETIGLIRRICCLGSRVRVVVLSGFDEQVYAVPSFKAGALGFVMKHEEPEVVLDAIRNVHAGRPRFSFEVSSLILNRMSAPRTQTMDPLRVGLSPRELEVARLMAAGNTSREIATLMGVSIKTVEAHRAHIRQKANLPNNVALVRFVMSLAEDRSQMAV